jgi:hypothetical protein
MQEDRFLPSYKYLKQGWDDTDPDDWIGFHYYEIYRRNMETFFPDVPVKNDLRQLSGKERNLWQHYSDFSDNNILLANMLDCIFLDWPIFKMSEDVYDSYPVIETINHHKKSIKEVVENKTGFQTLSRPQSFFQKIFFEKKSNHYIMSNDDLPLFDNYDYWGVYNG